MTSHHRVIWTHRRQGMTLIELIVGFSILVILGAILVSVTGQVRQQAFKADETSSLRQLTQGYLIYAADNDGKVIVGRPSHLEVAMTGLELVNHNGDPVVDREAKSRHVFRLLPYVGDIRVFFPGQARQFIEDVRDLGNEEYLISLCPTFGLNETYLGGNHDSRRWNNELESLIYKHQAVDPAKLIVFVSTIQGPANTVTSNAGDYFIGHHRVIPPNGENRDGTWMQRSYNADIPRNLGYIRLDNDGKAKVSHLDGSVALLDQDQLKDMRRWSNRAAYLNNPSYKPSGIRTY